VEPGKRRPGGGSTAFLLSQVGGQSALRFAELLVPLGLTPPDAGILYAMGSFEGLSQRALGKRLGILPSRLVVLVDELEGRGLVERRDTPEDRRTYALHLTEAGRRMLEEIGKVARAHDEVMCAALSLEEKAQLTRLLSRIAEEQKLTPGVHPGYRQLGRKGRREPC
jgi:DNA-binding MarR family transcriptional regulator